MMHIKIISLFAVVLLPISAPDANEADLAAISERGILLAGYDKAAWHATDAVMALHLPEGTVSRYIARKTTRGKSGTGTIFPFFMAKRRVPVSHVRRSPLQWLGALAIEPLV